jgi:hypothetical protein
VLAAGKLAPALVPGADVRFYRSAAEARKDAWLGSSPQTQTLKLRSLVEVDLRGGPVAVVIER